MMRALRFLASLPGKILFGLAVILALVLIGAAALLVPARFLKESHHAKAR